MEEIGNGNICQIGTEDSVPSFAVIGDSFADAFMPGLAAAATQAGVSGLVLTYSGCYPLLGTLQKNGVCDEFYQAAADAVLTNEQIAGVFFIARWSSAFEASRYGENMKSDMFVTDKEHQFPSVDTNRIVVRNGLDRLLGEISDKDIHLVTSIPEQAVNVPRTVGISLLMGWKAAPSVSRDAVNARYEFANDILENFADKYDADIINVADALCTASSCSGVSHNLPLYVDDNHISRTTAISLKELFRPALAGD
ncbi:SGNH hydrolase domain-containing protein [Loktanella sp. M215]|uniref:SGNH hydrolase domain-containing protein n=1 Tax=Loktanella sp. M215 TaxID=2675431 RepID=UPI001F3D4FA7|nr:hypothetical protein [Loktanella sp. M215]